jgi:hypothetical protein
MDTTILASVIVILTVCFNAVIIRAERESLTKDAELMSHLWHGLGWGIRAAVILSTYLSTGWQAALVVLFVTLLTWDPIYNLITTKGKKVFGLGTTSRIDILRTKIWNWIKSIWSKIVKK